MQALNVVVALRDALPALVLLGHLGDVAGKEILPEGVALGSVSAGIFVWCVYIVPFRCLGASEVRKLGGRATPPPARLENHPKHRASSKNLQQGN